MHFYFVWLAIALLLLSRSITSLCEICGKSWKCSGVVSDQSLRDDLRCDVCVYRDEVRCVGSVRSNGGSGVCLHVWWLWEYINRRAPSGRPRSTRRPRFIISPCSLWPAEKWQLIYLKINLYVNQRRTGAPLWLNAARLQLRDCQFASVGASLRTAEVNGADLGNVTLQRDGAVLTRAAAESRWVKSTPSGFCCRCAKHMMLVPICIIWRKH